MVVRIEFAGLGVDKALLIACGARAFADDAMQHNLFPERLYDPSKPNEQTEFRNQRLEERLKMERSYTLLAFDDQIEDGKRILGYAGWFAPGSKKPIPHLLETSKIDI